MGTLIRILFPVFLVTLNYCYVVVSKSIPANATISYKFFDHYADDVREAATIEIYRKFDWNLVMEPDIKLDLEITLEEAFHGKTVDVTVIRNVANDHCELVTCQHCEGRRFVINKNVYRDRRSTRARGEGDVIYDLEGITPCPVCLGMGVMPENNCQIYDKINETLALVIPPGCHPGYEVSLQDKGNILFKENKQKIMGRFVMTIEKVDGRNFKVHKDHLALSILLTPTQAIDGFVIEEPFIDGQSLLINRTDRITIPGSKVFFPIFSVQFLPFVRI